LVIMMIMDMVAITIDYVYARRVSSHQERVFSANDDIFCSTNGRHGGSIMDHGRKCGKRSMVRYSTVDRSG